MLTVRAMGGATYFGSSSRRLLSGATPWRYVWLLIAHNSGSASPTVCFARSSTSSLTTFCVASDPPEVERVDKRGT